MKKILRPIVSYALATLSGLCLVGGVALLSMR